MEEPNIQYSVGTTIEDQSGIFKIQRFQKDRHGHHLYYCEVLKWKIEPSQQVKSMYPENRMWIWVRPQSVEYITILEESK